MTKTYKFWKVNFFVKDVVAYGFAIGFFYTKEKDFCKSHFMIDLNLWNKYINISF